jgi:hypothetical protein
MAEVNPNSDRYFDLSLRLLTIFVLVSLVGCVVYLGSQLIPPFLHKPRAAAPPPPASIQTAPAPASVAAPAPRDEVLMDPHKTFKCQEKGGTVTFSDRACDSGPEQILPLNPSHAVPSAGAGH